MTSKAQIEQYRAQRPWLEHLGPAIFPDELAVLDLETEADCAADVPPPLKAALEPVGADEAIFERFFADASPAAAVAGAKTVNFGAAPHGGRWRPLPDHGGEPSLNARSFFHHSIVGSAEGCWGYFANGTSLESTFIVLKSGYFWQCMSLDEQADAQYRGNAYGLSAETEDNGNPNTDPWTKAQIETLVWLSWEVLRLCPSMRKQRLPSWDGAGLGYHSIFGAPSNLTPAVGKTCPGTIRKKQWADVVLPTFLRGGKLMLDDADKRYIEERLDAMRADIRDQDLRRLGHAIFTGAPKGSNQQYGPEKPGYEWLADASGLNEIGRQLAGLVKSGLKVDAAGLGAVLAPVLESAVERALEDSPAGGGLSDEDKQQIISGAGAAAADAIAARLSD